MQEFGQLVQGYAACCYCEKHGDQGVKQLTTEVDTPYNTLLGGAHVYQRLTSLADHPRRMMVEHLRNRRLTYSLLKQATSLDDEAYVELLDAAAKHKWNTKTFAEKIAEWKSSERSPLEALCGRLTGSQVPAKGRGRGGHVSALRAFFTACQNSANGASRACAR